VTNQTAEYLAAIEHSLQQALLSPDEQVTPLYEMMAYHLGWRSETLQPVSAPQGKRLRPLLCLLACQAAGGDWRSALPAATALELVHNFTLIHDDIEDRSDTRRHRPTVWKLWGIPQAINTGDAMWSVAKLALLEPSDVPLSPERLLEIVRTFESACLALCQGQYLDIAFEERATVSLDEYERMIAGKTGALLAACTESGALAAGASKEVAEYYRAFGAQLGLAFQMVDDILGVWGDPQVTGKSAADDLINHKKAFPLLYTLHWEAERGLNDLTTLIERPYREEDLAPMLKLLERAGARAATQARVDARLAGTLEALDRAGAAEPAYSILQELVHTLAVRSA